jgi:hypothetical protein
MKRAKLHDGRVFEFPPETPDEVIDRVVRRELGIQEPEPEPQLPPPDLPTATSQEHSAALIAHAIAALHKEDMPTVSSQKETAGFLADAISALKKEDSPTVSSQKELAEVISEAITVLGKEHPTIASQEGAIKELTKALKDIKEGFTVLKPLPIDNSVGLAIIRKIDSLINAMDAQSKRLIQAMNSQGERIVYALTADKTIVRDSQGRLEKVRVEGDV